MLVNPFSAKTDDVSTVTATEINNAGVAIASAIDGAGGSAGVPYAPATVIDVAGQGIKLSGVGNLGKVQLSSRSITRVQPIRFIPVSGTWTYDTNGSPLAGTALAVGIFWLAPPHGSTLTSVSVFIDPAAHGALPTMPSIQVSEVIMSTGVSSVLGSQADTSSPAATFSAPHAITKSGLAWPVDRSLAGYNVAFINENAPNDAYPTRIIGVSCTWTQTYMDDGAA